MNIPTSRFIALFAAFGTAACASANRSARTASTPGSGAARPPAKGCEFSGPPRSTLSWESGLAEGRSPGTAVARDAIVGRVIAVRTGAVADSVTLGFDGLRILASLAGDRGDIVCVQLAEPPRSRPAESW